MAKKFVEASVTKVFTETRLPKGEYTIEGFKTFERTFKGRRDEDVTMQVVGLFTKEGGETCIELNGLFNAPRRAQDENDPNKTYSIKPEGNVFDAFKTLVSGLNYKDGLAKANDPANGLIGRKFTLDWQEYVPVAYPTGYSYVPRANFVP